MLKAAEQVALEVVAAIGAHPGPARQAVEVPVGTVKRGIERFGHGRCRVLAVSGVGEVAQQPEALKALIVFAGLDGQKLQPSGLLAGRREGRCRRLRLIDRQIAQ